MSKKMKDWESDAIPSLVDSMPDTVFENKVEAKVETKQETKIEKKPEPVIAPVPKKAEKIYEYWPNGRRKFRTSIIGK
jgi:hypothetical protein